MRYSDYRKKVKKVRKIGIIGGIASVPIIAGVIALVVVTNTLENKRGEFETLSKCEITYKYGQGIVMSGSAYNSDVTFEYAHLNQNDWSETVPTRVGQYQVRGVSNGRSGKRYSDVQTFEITPVNLNVTIPEDKVKYGTKADIKVEGLVGTDYYSKDYVIDYSTYKETAATASIRGDSFKVYNKATEDVTDCYNITFNSKDIEYIKQHIYITFNDASKIYDGTALSKDDYNITSGSLFYNDQLVVEDGTSILNPGSVDNHHTAKVIDQDGDDNPNYEVHIQRDNTLEVRKINLSISSPNATKTYDGAPFDETTFKLNYNENLLLEDHVLEYSFTEEHKEVYTSGSFSNDYTYQIVDKITNDDVTDLYYNVTASVGTCNINKRSLSLVTDSLTHEYTGEEFSKNSYSITSGSLASTDKIVDSNWSSYGPNVDSGINYADFNIERIEDNSDVTDCYYFNRGYGNIEITKIPISVKFNANSPVVYDGTAHPIYDLTNITTTGLDTEKYHVEPYMPDYSKNSMTHYKQNGYSLSSNDLYVLVKDNNDIDISQNFSISYTFTSTSILKKDLEINIHNYEKFYDAKYLAEDLEDEKIEFDSNGLISGDRVVVDHLVSTNAVSISSGDLIIDYQVLNSSDEVVTTDYNITTNKGEYEIKAIPITVSVSLAAYSHIYDDSNIVPQGLIEFNVVSGTFMEGDSIDYDHNINYTVASSDVGTYPFTLPLQNIHIMNGSEERTQNYVIEVLQYGSYTIVTRDAYIYQSKYECTYDRIAHGINNEADFYTPDLVAGHTIQFDTSNDLYNPGVYEYYDDVSLENLLKPRVYSMNYSTEEKTSNYIFHFKDMYGNDTNSYSYTIHKRRIEAYASDYLEKYFDNTPFAPDIKDNSYYDVFDHEGNMTSLLSGDKIVFVDDTAPDYSNRPTSVADNYDTSKNQFTFKVRIEDKNGNDVSSMYDINIHPGLLYIMKQLIEVKSTSVSKTYDGQVISIASGEFEVTYDTSNGVYIDSGTLPHNYSLVANNTTGGTSTYLVGKYEFSVSINLYDVSSGYRQDYDHNSVELILRSVKFTYEIKKRTAIIKTSDINYKFNPDRPAPESRSVMNLASTDKLYFGNEQYNKSLRYYDSVEDKFDKGSYTNEVGPYRIMRGSVNVTASCYDVQIIEGTVTIS